MSDISASGLSDRELEILRLVATGASNKEIAQKLFISTNTVKVHLRNIFNKINAASRTEAAMYAVQIGLVQPISSEPIIPEDQPIAISTGQKQVVGNTMTSRKMTWLLPAILGIVLMASLIGFGIIFVSGSETPLPPTPIPPTPTLLPRWETLSPPPTTREGMAVTSFENELFVMGGRDESGITNITEKYSPDDDTWSLMASKIIPTTDIGATSLAGGIYVPGGMTGDGKTTDLVEMYDPRSNTWIQKAPLPVKLSAYAIVAFEGNLYIFGGWDGTEYTNAVYMYDPDQDVWIEKSPMPTARGYATAAVAGGKIYVFGGKNSEQILDITEVYQPDLDSGLTIPWTIATPLPFGRAKMGIANIADIIYLLGGEGPTQDIVVLAYDPRDESWGQIEAPLPSNWSSLGSQPIGTRLFALGGKTEEGLVNEMWGFQALFTISLPIVR